MGKTDDSNTPYLNVHIWDLAKMERKASWSHKNAETWRIQWTYDEQFYGRLVTNEVQFFSVDNLSTVRARLKLEGVGGFSVSPGKNPSVAVFVPEKKGMPAIVRIFGILSFNYPLSNKTFFKADQVEFLWNKMGTNALVLTRTDTDSSGKSYYGETNLYYLSAVGNYDCRVTLDAQGPIHDISWGPNGNEFIVVYGNMPAHAALFDARANKIFDFGQGSRNTVRYSPKGRFMLLAGFGNLAGYIEMWDRKTMQKYAQFKEDAAVFCEFMPDGFHILTATTTPRLRVDNRFRIRDLSGNIVWERNFKELYQVAQQPTNADYPDEFAAKLSVSSTMNKTSVEKIIEPVKSAYVPPHLRNKTGPVGSSQPAVAAAKNGTQKSAATNGGSLVKAGTQKQVQLEAAEKQVLGLKRKLRAIDALKVKNDAGDALEKNQLAKLEQEASLKSELEALEAAVANMTA